MPCALSCPTIRSLKTRCNGEKDLTRVELGLELGLEAACASPVAAGLRALRSSAQFGEAALPRLAHQLRLATLHQCRKLGPSRRHLTSPALRP